MVKRAGFVGAAVNGASMAGTVVLWLSLFLLPNGFDVVVISCKIYRATAMGDAFTPEELAVQKAGVMSG